MNFYTKQQIVENVLKTYILKPRYTERNDSTKLIMKNERYNY